jgi:hypothetical protein
MRRNALRNEAINDNDRIFIVAPALVEGLRLALQTTSTIQEFGGE